MQTVERSEPWHEVFNRISRRISQSVGSHWAFMLAALVILVWLVSGPIFRFSDTWQLVINTGTTVITFLMVFLIQNTQNHDARAVHLKLDEIIRSIQGARNELIDLEDVTDERLDELQAEFERIHRMGGSDLGTLLQHIETERIRRSK